MTDRFDSVLVAVRQKLKALSASPKHHISALPKNMPTKGIYLFSERGRPLYVGRSNNLRRRLQNHTRNQHNVAAFAFLLARRRTGNLRASYTKKGSRLDLIRNPIFREAFDAARARIRKMDVQFIGEPDPVRQAVLEIYTAVQTQARFNDFDNH
jgi:hypothetical protein